MDGLWLSPDTKPSEAAVIALHGLGASCNDLLPLCNAIAAHACEQGASDALDHTDDIQSFLNTAPRPTTYVLPQAPHQPVAIADNQSIPSWFNIYSVARDAKRDAEGLEKCSDFVCSITEELNRKGIPDDKISIGGFSQGGIVALHCLCRYPKRFAGAFALSSCLANDEPISTGGGSPVFISHGAQDSVIPLDYAQETHKLLSSRGFDVQMYIQDTLAHSIDGATVQQLAQWLNKRLP